MPGQQNVFNEPYKALVAERLRSRDLCLSYGCNPSLFDMSSTQPMISKHQALMLAAGPDFLLCARAPCQPCCSEHAISDSQVWHALLRQKKLGACQHPLLMMAEHLWTKASSCCKRCEVWQGLHASPVSAPKASQLALHHQWDAHIGPVSEPYYHLSLSGRSLRFLHKIWCL